jgi:hypothetical protein
MEHAILVDEIGAPIGSTDKEYAHFDNTPAHPAFTDCVFDSGGPQLGNTMPEPTDPVPAGTAPTSPGGA